MLRSREVHKSRPFLRFMKKWVEGNKREVKSYFRARGQPLIFSSRSRREQQSDSNILQTGEQTNYILSQPQYAKFNTATDLEEEKKRGQKWKIDIFFTMHKNPFRVTVFDFEYVETVRLFCRAIFFCMRFNYVTSSPVKGKIYIYLLYYTKA